MNAVRKLLDEGRSVNEHTEEGESLLCLACSAGYYELAQVSRNYLKGLKLWKDFDVLFLLLIKEMIIRGQIPSFWAVGEIETGT